MKSMCIVQSNFVPWLGFFELLVRSDLVIIADELQYTKGDWRNRNLLEINEEIKWLTLPVKRVNGLQTKISEVEIDGRYNWTREFFNKIRYAYSRQENYNQLQELLDSLSIDLPTFAKLSDINIHILKTIMFMLGINTSIVVQDKEIEDLDKNSRLIKLCKSHSATAYVSGERARGYLDLSLFDSNGIEVKWIDYSMTLAFLREFNLSTSPPLSILDTIAKVPLSEIKEFISNAKCS